MQLPIGYEQKKTQQKLNTPIAHFNHPLQPMLNFLKSPLCFETRNEIAASYQKPPSISHKLPWMDYDPQTECFHLDDGRSVAAVFELTDVPMVSASNHRVTE